MTLVFIKLGIRFLIFALVFGFVSYRSKKISIQPKLALPMVALVFALLNTSIYWMAKPLLNLATLGMFAFLIPFMLNGLFLYATVWLTQRMRIKVELGGLVSMFWIAVLLTVTHGALYLALDILAA